MHTSRGRSGRGTFTWASQKSAQNIEGGARGWLGEQKKKIVDFCDRNAGPCGHGFFRPISIRSERRAKRVGQTTMRADSRRFAAR